MDNADASPRSWVSFLAAFIVALETLMVVAIGVGYVIYAVVDTSQEATPAIVLAVFAILLAAGLGACAWGLWTRKRWARSFALTWQLLQMAAAVATWPTSPEIAMGLMAAAAVVLVVVVRETRHDMRAGVDPLA